MIKAAIEHLLRRHGYELKVSGTPVRGFDHFLQFVRARGFSPRTVIDVGVGDGTPWLYRAFPQAHFVLFEALKEFEPRLQEICREIDAEYHLCGLGEAAGSLDINIPVHVPTGSSLLPRTARQAEAQRGTRSEETIPRRIDIRRLDEFTGFIGPVMLKIDVEGAELSVLRGAGRLLEDVELVLCEISVMPRHEGEADFVEIATFLKGFGLTLFDIVDMSQRGRDGPLAYIDVAFVRTDSALRRV